MEAMQPCARAIAVGLDGTILAAGDADDVDGLRGPETHVSDLHGLTVVPGFNDCHMHILPYGIDLSRADLSPQAGVTGIPALIRTLRNWSDENPRSEWIVGSRYNQNLFPNAAHPSLEELDDAFPDRPVYLKQTSGHAASVNSLALKLAGVTRNTPNPPGGEIARNSLDEPTGVLLEWPAMRLVADLIPKPNKAAMEAAILRANLALVRAGITSASDLETGSHGMDTEISAYRQAAEDGAPVRMTLFPGATHFGIPEDVPEQSDFARRHLEGESGIRIGPMKLYSDGALTVRTAALREPYMDGSGNGMLLHEPDELLAYIQSGHRAGWQIATHAIGDRAVELVLDCLNSAQEMLLRPSPRHRIEHAMLLDSGLIARLKIEKVIPVLQPEFISRLGDAYLLGLGLERASRLNPVASLQAAGIGVPFSSDCPVVPGAPLDGIRAAVRRTTASGTVLGPDECISATDAVRNYTYWAAYSTFDETETGTISPGKRADLTVLSADPTVDLDNCEVVATIIGGHTVYGSERLG